MTTMHECGPECVTSWPPGRKCHCTGCSKNFSKISNFDKHRAGGECVAPELVGLVQNKFGVWIQEGEVDFTERLAAAKEKGKVVDV